ncbi:MAG: bifunctional hydroxymethylpyrimidine kinase/phosphomethylpyrimidine kinase [Prevotella sp.]|jgi:hydroxymethylpyrimidine/phosphomethylpyrimidine kinase
MSRHCIPVLTIAGSDSSGGAGIQADIKTISALGGYAAAAITAVTAQNTMGVTAIEAVFPEVVEAQIHAVMTDIAPRSVKIGMTGNRATIDAIAHGLSDYADVPLVLDPVMVSTSGCRLTKDDATELLIKRLVPMATLLTPNLPETGQLVGHDVFAMAERDDAARHILDMGCGAVLIKGGHDEDCDTMEDRLYRFDAHGRITIDRFTHRRIDTPNTHGTGCTLSSAIATYLAMGEPLVEAVEKGVTYLHKALAQGADLAIGHGHGPVNHTFSPLPMRVD